MKLSIILFCTICFSMIFGCSTQIQNSDTHAVKIEETYSGVSEVIYEAQRPDDIVIIDYENFGLLTDLVTLRIREKDADFVSDTVTVKKGFFSALKLVAMELGETLKGLILGKPGEFGELSLVVDYLTYETTAKIKAKDLEIVKFTVCIDKEPKGLYDSEPFYLYLGTISFKSKKRVGFTRDNDNPGKMIPQYEETITTETASYCNL